MAFGAEDIITQGTLRCSSGEVLPLESTQIQAVVSGPVAEVEFVQRFRNDLNHAH